MPNPARWLDLSRIYFLFLLSVFIFLFALVSILKNPVNFLGITKKILLTFGPAEIILVIGFQVYNRLSFFPFSLPLLLFVGFFAFLTGIFLLFKLQKYRKAGEFWQEFKIKEKKERSRNKNWTLGFFLAIIVILNLFFGSYHLAEFAAVDEPLWTFNRIPKFWNNVKEREFYKTMVSDKPGITVAILSGIGLNWTNPKEYQLFEGEDKANEGIPGIKKMNFAMRFPILLFNAILLIPLYFFIRRLAEKKTAAFSLILIGLSPILLGMSTIINPDSLLWSISALAFLGYLVYLQDHEKKYLYLSGFFLGLAILTKYIANIFYVYFFGLIFLEYIFKREKYTDIPGYFQRAFRDYFSLVLVSLLTFFLFLPAAWVNVMRVLEGTILSKAFIKFWPVFLLLLAQFIIDMKFLKSRILEKIMKKMIRLRKIIVGIILFIFILSIAATILNTYSGMKPYDFESILASPKSSYLNSNFFSLYLANFYSLIFGIVPLAFLALVFWPINFIVGKKEKIFWPVYIVLFIIVYYLASTVENVSATVRYQIIVYPLALIVGAKGLT
ncbi:MAG TPA: glycosyltransferase family 39 protein, partial [Patescibacteria group bacterium]|nr:glycosyltransferase family 39 protein [Patescibacteria group bacterium]